jgi:hypothetical protein
MSTVKSEISAKAAPSVTSAAAAVTSSAAAATKSSPSLVAAAAPDAPAAAASSGLEEDDWTSSEQKALEVYSSHCFAHFSFPDYLGVMFFAVGVERISGFNGSG